MNKAIVAGVVGRHGGLAALVACWLLAQSVFGVPLTEIHIRDPFILPVEQSHQYLVYRHEWVQVRDGGMKLLPLSKDLSEAVSPPQLLFRGSDAPWAPRGRDRYITDGPALYRSKSGKLFMLWSSFSETGYTTGIAISDSGKVVGPWRQQTEPFFREDGGHAMIFRRFDGVLMVALWTWRCGRHGSSP